MKRLLLLRHAKSSWGDAALDDHDRPLADRGHRAAKRMGQYFADERIKPDLILVSSAKRAQETFHHLETVLGSQRNETRPELYGISPADFLELLAQYGEDIGSILVIGHNPTFEETAWMVLSKDSRQSAEARDLLMKYPTGALADISLPIDSWADLKPGIGHLDRFVKPRSL